MSGLYDGPWLPCPDCGGSGENHYFHDMTCRGCKGEGRVPEYNDEQEDGDDE